SVFTDTVNGYSMTVNVIVYGLDRYEVARILSSNAGKMLGTVPKIYSELGCEDPECGDPMCRNADHRRIIDIK
ncbi:MAG: hypothetical protein FWG19_00860, partial [Methanomassiliicoccaceae archaeon]|nr:hypothetical protein [Methanomassiliicoccaceae archaeon]